MSTCPFCSEEITADAAQCPSCGMELPAPSPANIDDAPPVQPSKSNAKKWILIGGAGCGFCLLILACLAAFLLPMVSRARDAVRERAAQAAASNEQFPDSDEQLMEMGTVSSEDDSGSGGGPVPLPPATTVPPAEKTPGSQPKLDEPSVQAADDAVAALKKLGARIRENEQGEVVEVNLVNRKITDAGLVHLKGLTRLQALNLRDTPITDAGLVHLKGLTDLQRLRIGSARHKATVTDAGLVHLKNLKKLKTLEMQWTRITDAGLGQLAEFKLTRLRIPSRATTDLGLKHFLMASEAATTLNLYGWHITDAGLVYLEDLPELETLRLGLTKVTDAGLIHLKHLDKLQSLGLSRTQVTDAGLAHLGQMTALRTLDLGETRISAAGLEHLKGLTRLQVLGLFNTEITDAGLVNLKGLVKLQMLNLNKSKVTDAGIAELQKSLPNCKISK